MGGGSSKRVTAAPSTKKKRDARKVRSQTPLVFFQHRVGVDVSAVHVLLL
jgi:hypothetical protein